MGEGLFCFCQLCTWFSLPSGHGIHSYLYGVEERYFVFNSIKSWPLIWSRRISIVGSKLSLLPGRVTVEGLVRLTTLGRCHNHMGSIGQKGPHYGVVRRQAIVWCKFCEIWWRDEALNALRKRPHKHLLRRLMMKKMNNLNDTLSGLSFFFVLFGQNNIVLAPKVLIYRFDQSSIWSFSF